jgi:hypothetical protein
MKRIFVFWIIGCVLVGIAAGHHETRCPNDPPPSSGEFITAISAWPALLVWGVVNSRVPECKTAS